MSGMTKNVTSDTCDAKRQPIGPDEWRERDIGLES
jgi:hypothetical protein